MDELSGLVQRVRNGDREAEDRLFEELRPIVRRFADGMRGQVDASDITQISLMKVLHSLPQYRGSSDKEFTGWVKRIVHTKRIDAYRTKKTGKEAPLPDQIPADTSTPSRQIRNLEEAHQIEMALAQLPDEQRDAVRMRHLEELSIAEIAARLGNPSEDAVRQLIRRGMMKLRDSLKRQSEGDGR